MPNDGNLIIGIEAPQLQKVVSGMNSLVQGVEKCTTVVSELTRTMNSFSSASVSMASRSSGAFSQAQKDLSEYKKKMLDVAATGRLNGNAAALMSAKYNSLASVVNNATRAVESKINADRNSAKATIEQANALARVSKEEAALQKALGSPVKVTPLEDIQRTIKMTTELNAQKQAVQQVAAAEKQRTTEVREAEKAVKAQVAAQKLAAKSGDYSQSRNALAAYNLQLKDAIASGVKSKQELASMSTEQKRLAASVAKTDSEFKKLTSTGFSVADMFKRMGTAGQIAFGSLVAMAVRRVTMEIGNFVTSSSMAARTMDGVVNAFAAGAGGFEGAGRELAYVRKTADEMGIAITSAYEPYSKFMTSFTRSGGSIASSRQIFSDISAAAVSLHLTAEQTGNVYVALEQMANKGTVQMEELKRQLGNNLPGAFELASESMGVTTAQLTDMMKKGQVMSSDFLPKFAAKVKEVLAGSLPLATKQAQAEFNRLSTDTFDAQVAFGKLINEIAVGFIPTIRGAMQGLTVFVTKVQELSPIFSGITAAIAPFVVLVGGVMLANLIKASAATGVLATAQAALTASFVMTTAVAGKATIGVTATAVAMDLCAIATNGFNAAVELLNLNPFIAGLTAVAAVVSIFAFNISKGSAELAKSKNAMSESIIKSTAFGSTLNALSQEYFKLKKSSNMSLQEQQRLSELTDELKGKYPGVIELLNKEALGHDRITKSLILELAAMQKLAQAKSIDAEYKKGMDALNKERWHLGKNFSWVNPLNQSQKSKSEVEHELELSQIAVDGLRRVNQEYAAAKNLANSTTTSSRAGGRSGGSGGNGGSGEPKTAWDNLNSQVSAREELIQSYLVQGKSIDGLIPKYVELKAKQESVNKTMQDLTATSKDGWEVLNAQVSQKESEIRSNLAQGKSVEKLIPAYMGLKQRQEQVNASMQALTSTTPVLVDSWKKLEENLTKAEQAYKSMLSSSNQYTSAQLKEQESIMMGLKVQVQYNKALESSSDLMGVSNRAASQLADTLVDDLFTALGEGETIWSRFQDAGLAAFKALATDWVKTKASMMGKGFQAGWNVQSLYDTATGGSGSFIDSLMSGFTGMAQGAKGQPLGGTSESPTSLFEKMDTAGITQTTEAIQKFTQANSDLAGMTSSTLAPAMSTAISSISAVASPATTAADSLVTMGASAPMAAIGTMGIAASMTLMAPAAKMAAPAMTQMGIALGVIASEASKAAIAMSELAIATAAESVAKIPFVGGFLAPAAALATGAAIGMGATMAGAGLAAGAVASGVGNLIGGGLSGAGSLLSGNVVKHAKGGVVSSPTAFPMQGGDIGIAGEAGTEVIAPAVRMSNGDVGVGAVAPNVVVNNYANAAVEVIRRPNNEMEIKVTELNAMLSSSRSNKGMSNAQSRLSTKGKQIG